MFTYIAERYDWFDHVASLGNDYLWRPRALWDLDRFRERRPTHRVLDVGCGTGDLTVLSAIQFPHAKVVGADFTAAMLQRAVERTDPKRYDGRVAYGRATALRLPFRSGQFDVAMSAFVARNLPRLGDAFRENPTGPISDRHAAHARDRRNPSPRRSGRSSMPTSIGSSPGWGPRSTVPDPIGTFPSRSVSCPVVKA